MARYDRLQSSAFMLGAVLVASFAGTSAQAQEEEEELDRTPVDCVVMERIDRDVAVSNRTIVFYMRGGRMIYRNDMPGDCPTLQRGETRLVYNYRTQTARLSRLCDTDSITVERQEGVSCGLGLFLPITATEAETLANDPAAALVVPQQPTAPTAPTAPTQSQAEITTVIQVPAAASPQCLASATTGYFQANTVARVEGSIKIEGCTAAAGEYTIIARIRDESGESKTIEFAETFSRDNDQDLTFKGDYPIGDNTELVSVRTRGLRCECADQPAQ